MATLGMQVQYSLTGGLKGPFKAFCHKQLPVVAENDYEGNESEPKQ